MKLKALMAKVCIFLLALSSASVIDAQKRKSPKKPIPRAIQIDQTVITIPDIKDFAFVVEVDKNAAITLRIQKTENNEFLGRASSNKNLTDFFSAFSLLQDGKSSNRAQTALDPVVIVKADRSLNFGQVVEVIRSLRVSQKQKIKLQLSENYYVGIPPLGNENEILKPNPNFLLVRLQDDSKILLNTEISGDFENTAPLKEKLREIFKERENFGILRPGTNEIERTVFITAPPATNFVDVIKLIQEVKEAGAEPVALQLEEIFPQIRIIARNKK